MIEQIGVALPFTAFYSTLGLGTTGLTVTVDVYRNGTEIVTAGACADAGDGLYTYTLAAESNNAEGVYVAVFKTATTTVDQQHLPAAWYVGKAGLENLDAPISMVDTVVDAINTRLPSDPADESLLETYISAETSGLATGAALGIVASVVSTIEGYTAGIADVPTVGEIDAQLSGTHGAGTWSDAGGSGAIDWSDQFIVTVGGLPRDGVFVRFTTDAAMLNTVATGTTNTFGKLDALMLDAGTYYVWLQLAGVNFAQPAGTEVVA